MPDNKLPKGAAEYKPWTEDELGAMSKVDEELIADVMEDASPELRDLLNAEPDEE